MTDRRQVLRDWLAEEKFSCSCGESNPVCLVLHSRNPAKHDLDLYTAIRYKYSPKAVQEFAITADILCLNCRAKNTRS